MHVPAILPIKAYSERLSNKNTRLFAGKPLFHHVASLLQRSSIISEIIVDTDSEDIATEAVKNFPKVRVVMRPPELCGDMVPFESIIEHDISLSESEHFVQTFSTCPLLSQATLEKAIQVYFKSLQGFDSLFSVKKIQKHLYWESGKKINYHPEALRTQDLPPIYARNACLFVFSKESFYNSNSRIGQKPQMFPMNAIESVDIDEESDFIIAELLYRHFYSAT